MGDTKEFWAATPPQPPQRDGSRAPGAPPGAGARDATPSFLRSPGPAPAGGPPPRRESLAPVLAVRKSYVIMRRVRLALVGLAAIALIAAAILLVRSHLIAKEVEETIAAALAAEATGGAEEIRSARERLSELVASRGDRAPALEASAWLHVVEALLFGPEEPLAKAAAESLARAGGEPGPVGTAAAAGLAVLHDRGDEALQIAGRGIAAHPGEPRLKLVRAAALAAKGDRGAGVSAFLDAALQSPTYLPLSVAGLEAAIEADDPGHTRQLAAVLETSGKGNRLLALLAKAAAGLGAWGDDGADPAGAAGSAKALATAEDGIAKAPPKIGILGRYVEGRLLLAGGEPEKAAAALKLAAGASDAENVLAWYGLATFESAGTDAAIAALDARPGAKGPAILDLRARALLACDRVDRAAPAVEALKGTGALPARAASLGLELAVKRGDTAAALRDLPEELGPSRAGLVVELFFQLEDAADKKGVLKLAKALRGGLEGCAKVMRTWHTQGVGPAVKKMTAEDAEPCVGALAGRLLWGRIEPGKLGRALGRATPEMRASPQLAVIEAMAAWLTDGREAALERLGRVEAMRPEAAPTKRALARAYLEMELPERAAAALDGLDDPESLALLYRAGREAKDKGAERLVEEARERNAKSPHPALAWVIVHAQSAAGENERAARTAEEILPNAGRWTAEIAEAGAKAINLSGDRSDADRLLTGTARKIGASYGVDEMWEIELAYVRLNLLRGGGKFTRRATNALGDLRRDGAVDARIHLSAGMLAARSGDREDAAEAFRKALALNPSLGTAYAQLRKLGELDDATAATMKKVLPGFKP